MLRSTTAAIAAIILCAHPSSAQIRGSESAVVGQTIDGTTITMEYSRPVAMGRDLFGALVPYGLPWTGANWATTLEADKDIRINGAEVPAGKYSVWLIPREGDWTFFLEPNARLFHFQKPDSTDQQIRVATTPEEAEYVDMLTWSFPAVRGDGARLQMRWGTTVVPLDIVVQPSRAVALSPEQRAPYVGAYDMTFPEGIGWPTEARFEVFEEGDMLRGRLPFPIHPGDDLDFDLVPAGPDSFSAALYHDGVLFNVEMGVTFDFTVEEDRATDIHLRGIEGTIFGQGSRAEGAGTSQ
jgi:hypothetical protein